MSYVFNYETSFQKWILMDFCPGKNNNYMSHPSISFQVEGLNIEQKKEGNQDRGLMWVRGKKHELKICKLVSDRINPTSFPRNSPFLEWTRGFFKCTKQTPLYILYVALYFLSFKSTFFSFCLVPFIKSQVLF